MCPWGITPRSTSLRRSSWNWTMNVRFCASAVVPCLGGGGVGPFFVVWPGPTDAYLRQGDSVLELNKRKFWRSATCQKPVDHFPKKQCDYFRLTLGMPLRSWIPMWPSFNVGHHEAVWRWELAAAFCNCAAAEAIRASCHLSHLVYVARKWQSIIFIIVHFLASPSA